MNNKNIKERYKNAINAFKTKIENKGEPTVLKIEKIEQEYDEYSKKLKNDKINLGAMILAGTVITALATKVLFLDVDGFELELAKTMGFALGGAIGTSMILLSSDNYIKDRFNSNVEANKQLEEYEKIFEEDELKKEEKVTVKRR